MTNVSPSVKEALPNVNHFISSYKWINKKKDYFLSLVQMLKSIRSEKTTPNLWIYPLTGRGEQPISGTVRCMFPHENSIS